MPDRRPPHKGFLHDTRKLLDIHIDRDDSAVRVVAVGEIDSATTPKLDAALGEPAGDDAVRRLVVDLAGVTFIDSSGLHALCRKATAADQDGFDFAVVGVRDHIRQVFVLTGVDKIVPLAEE